MSFFAPVLACGGVFFFFLKFNVRYVYLKIVYNSWKFSRFSGSIWWAKTIRPKCSIRNTISVQEFAGSQYNPCEIATSCMSNGTFHDPKARFCTRCSDAILSPWHYTEKNIHVNIYHFCGKETFFLGWNVNGNLSWERRAPNDSMKIWIFIPKSLILGIFVLLLNQK